MYDAYYGLSDRPFQLTPDPRFYFESATHRKAMAYLGYGLAQGEGFIVITGDIGTGKTTLVGHLMATIDKARLTAVKLVSTQVEADDLLRLTAQAFGLPAGTATKAQLLDRIERFLGDQARSGKRTLLIVDEAQQLSAPALEELRMLSNFTLGEQPLLQIFLLGQPEFRDLMASDRLEQLRQRVIATHHLEPMGADEIGGYVEHRLRKAGAAGRPRFTPDAHARLFAATGGVPRKLNVLAARVLMMGAVEEKDVIDGALVDAAAADLARDSQVPARPAAEGDGRVRPFGDRGAGEPGMRRGSVTPLRAEAPDHALVERVASLEAKLEEQEAMLRRVLALLVDWVEGDVAQVPRNSVA